jgi:hypothetical protein
VTALAKWEGRTVVEGECTSVVYCIAGAYPQLALGSAVGMGLT